MEQSYDLRNEASDAPFSPVTLKLGWNPLKKLSIAYKTLIPVEDDDNTIHGLETIFSNSRGDKVSLDYRYNENEDIEQINGNLNVWILPEVAAALDFEHSIAESETNEARFSLTYFAQCWSVKLQTQHTPTDEKVLLVFNLANIGSSLGLGL
jgi:LPS-assembly protein